MKRTFIFTVAAALVGMLAFSGGALAATPDLGDLIVLYRNASGLPIPTDVESVLDPEINDYVDGGRCQQPLPADPLPAADVCPTACLVEAVVDGTSTGVTVVDVDPLSCAVVGGCEGCTQEVDFGRTSVIRSPDAVMVQSLAEAVSKLGTAACLSLDPSGRLVTTSEIDGEVVSAAIDSPLENLAIYWQLMQTGYLGAAGNPIELPDPIVLNTAARGFGAAADKTGKVTVDQVVYSNEIMGLLDVPTYLPQLCVTVREEVQGDMEEVEKCVLDYSAYVYEREMNFAQLPAPPYIPADYPTPGWFEYLGVVDPDATPVLFQIIQGPILDSVFCLDSLGLPVVPEDGVCLGSIAPGFVDGNVGGFTQAADDTREVIEFTHDRPMPLGYETPVPLCGEPLPDVFDVSISPDSGLQVPVRMVIGTEGREVILTVANAGPSTATGTATVVGIATNGQTVFSQSQGFDLDANRTQSWTWMFSLDFATTVTWTATATPECDDCDLNMANNTVTETTIVRGTGSGGGGGNGNRP